MKKRLTQWITVVLAFSLLLQTQTAMAFATEGPDIKGKAAIVYCATTGEVIYEEEADKAMNPASITKLMTCLLAAEQLDLQQEIEITEEATQVIPTKLYLKTGEKLTVEDLLYGALLVSANDAAAALGIAVSGSTKKFAKLMNERAKALGCTNTQFKNANGLKADGHYSTARDIALISEAAFANETVRKIAGTITYTIKETNKAEARELENGNLLLTGGIAETPQGNVKVKKYDGVFGGKTGTTETYTATMTAGLDDDGMEMYAVVLGTTMKRRYSDIKRLLDYGRENVSKYVVFEKHDAFGEAKLTGGATDRVEALASEPGYINLPEGVSASLATTKVIYEEDLVAPVKKGQKVGIVEIYLDDEKIRQIDLLAAEDVEEGWVLSKYGITNFETVVMCTIAGLIVALFIAILVLRAVNRKRRKKRRQQKLRQAALRQLERERDVKQRDWPY